eukprot:Nitzschia sp. Nitz4//scaffold161_size51353//6531//8159//NITZ4_006940-RA/size51353-processed-gene-0.55-mRNA-1//1//CDS//3329537885//6013//frame0
MSTPTSPAEVSNQIKQLIKEVSDTRADATRLDELRRVYSRLAADGELTFGTPPPENQVAAKWHSFLMKNHKKLVSQLCDRVELGRHSAIRCLWGVIAGSPCTTPNKYHQVHLDLLLQWLRAMTQQESEEMDRAMRHMVEGEFIKPFRDVQYFALIALTRLAHEAYENPNDTGNVAEKILELLMIIPVPKSQEEMDESQYLFPPPKDIKPEDEAKVEEVSDDDEEEDDDDDNNESSDEEEEKPQKETSRPQKRQKVQYKLTFQRKGRFLREYQKAWLAVLRLHLSLHSLKRSLSFLSHYVLDFVPTPLRFADFFMQAYTDHGSGIVGVLALDGIFSLITEHGLEYPDFYKQLYRLVSSRVLYAKYRSRFYGLLTKCLVRNQMLPAHVVAAFCKRLCRAALSGPPAGALFVLALVSNLLRKHPECACLVHRQGDDKMEDKFLAEENDPTQTQALQSSLWELKALEQHYYHPISTLAESIGTPGEAKAPYHNIEDFSEHTYKSLFDQERKKKGNKTALTFKEPEALFGKNDMFAGFLSIGEEASA